MNSMSLLLQRNTLRQTLGCWFGVIMLSFNLGNAHEGLYTVGEQTRLGSSTDLDTRDARRLIS